MILSIEQGKEFWDFFYKEINLDDYKYKFLREDIQRINQGTQSIYDITFFQVQNDGWILIIVSEGLIVYGKNWSLNQFDEISECLDLKRFKNYLVYGESQLIKKLIEHFSVTDFFVEQERIFYRTSSSTNAASPELNIRLGRKEDINILAKMLQQYYHEEYEGRNDKEIQQLIFDITYHVYKESIYVLGNSQNQIISFCTILNPDIGIMFTERNHRNNGYGKLILSFCTRLILQFNEEAFLMTDKKNPSSMQLLSVRATKASMSMGTIE